MINPDLPLGEIEAQPTRAAAVQTHIERVNKIHDRAAEALDAMRVSGGQTLDEFLAAHQ